MKTVTLRVLNSARTFLPFLEWIPMLTKKTLKADLFAGITVAFVLIPQSLAYAQLAGLPPHYGLYASFLPPVIAALFGSSKQLSTGPAAVFSLMTATALSPLASAGSTEFFAYAVLMSLLLGLFQLLMGALRLGELFSFLSHPVIYGFTNAAAIIIATTQLSAFFGVRVGQFPHHYQAVLAVFGEAASHAHWPTFLVGVAAMLGMILLRKIFPKLPSVLMIVVVSTGLSWLLGYSGTVVGTIPKGVAEFSPPSIDFSVLPRLLLPVVTMALIGFTEAVSISQAIAVKTKQRLDPNRELIGQGLANVVGAFNRSYPVSGSFSRTAVNFQAGATSGLAGVFASLVVLSTLLLFTPLLFYLPQVVLAAIIVLSVGGLVDLRKFRHIWFTNRYDGVASLLTFAGTLWFAPVLEKGVLLGVVFSIAHYVYRNVHPQVVFLSKYKDGALHDAERFQLDRCENIACVRLDAPLFFANASYFENEIIAYLSEHEHVRDILVVASGINEIDATGEEMLSSLTQSFTKAKKHLYFSDVKAPVREVLRKTGLWDEIGEDRFFQTSKEAVEFLLKHARKKHTHEDMNACPLVRYIKAPEQVHVQKDKRETIAYFYRKLFP